MATVLEPLAPCPPAPYDPREILRERRAEAVAAIRVTTSTGKEFDGDEASQARMSRAIQIGQITGQTSVDWTLADNSVVTVTGPELIEALALAGLEQARLWPIIEGASA